MGIINVGKRSIVHLIGFLVIVLLVTFVLTNHYKKKEFSQEIYFIVERVEESPALRCSYYNKEGNKLLLNSYTFYAPSEIEKGDIITKKANSNQIVIYRKNSLGIDEIQRVIDIK